MTKEYKLYIDGEFRDPASGGTIGVIDPALGREFASVAYGDREDAAKAIEAAERAFPAWREVNVYERASYLHKVADHMRERADSIAEAMTREVGKPLPESRAEVMGSAATLDWSGEEAKRHYGECIPSNLNHKRILYMRAPVGVCAGIGPWNFPVLLLCRKLGPALAVGCTMVARAASQTPRAAMEMFGCFHDAGLPPGVANLVTGPAGEQGKEFIENPAVRKISFTGSVEVGKYLMEASAKQLKKLSLELGGHAPAIVCPDMDVKEAAAICVDGKFRNAGQTCIAPSRFFVPEERAAEFTEEAARLSSELKVGNGLEQDTRVGPLIDELRRAATEALVDDVRKKGGKVVCGGKRPQGDEFKQGYFYEPTVLTDLTPDMAVLNQEPFAPLIPVIPYRDLDEAIKRANDVPFGLASYVVSRDVRHIYRVGEKLESGVVGVNDFTPVAPQTPFGGWKESGMGREGWHQGLDAYTEIKFMSIVI